jgi:hypothetical protein
MTTSKSGGLDAADAILVRPVLVRVMEVNCAKACPRGSRGSGFDDSADDDEMTEIVGERATPWCLEISPSSVVEGDGVPQFSLEGGEWEVLSDVGAEIC